MNNVSVLVVDDSEEDRYLLKRYLKPIEQVTEIFEARDGREAMEFFRAYPENRERFGDKYPPVLVFLDINMPLMNGWEFLEAFGELRREVPIDAPVVVMFTTSALDRDRLKAQEIDFVTDFVVKGKIETQSLAQLIAEASG